ncbi:MAG TPA: gliding motility-associated ABC transporter ATP-binding subunit GldA [Flavisolibacter sp.]|jgi:ABC-2 type transport system ATP-binding protein|nr:gliding motility-associated ABC transporter ATP-binding subunit GldA [Flavisolibacter sp.]
MSITVKNLTKTYGEQKAVDAISFMVNKGEIVGFLGPNGAGKSTTMKMITGYLAPDSGAISVSGVDVIKDPQTAKKKIGYLPESNALYYDMYIKEYLEFMADVHHVANKQQAISHVVEQVGLTREKAKKIGQLSKGYKQRVGLAAALLHNPEVLILDEPTSGLDPNQIVEIRNVIKEQGRDKLVLFSSHILQEVEAICDRVIIINRGKIVADDKLSSLQQRSTTNIVRVQFKEALEAEWLRHLAGVKTVNKVDTQTWMIETAEPDTVRNELKKLERENNLDIVSLQTESQSLEEVFRTLTAGNTAQASNTATNNNE